MKYIILIIGLAISPFFYSQEIFPEEFPKELPEKFQITLDMDSVNYYTNNRKEAKTNKINSLSYLGQFSHKEMFESGLIGLNYDEVETYLNEIAEKLISKELLTKLNIHVYPSLENEVNAYAISDGTILFNLSNFLYLESEAEIAYILAHEIGHQISEHNSSIEWINYIIKNRAKNKKAYESASQNSEIDADRKAIDMLLISGYNKNAAISTEEFFISLENKRKELVLYSKNGYLKTHPPSQERLDSAKFWINNETGGSNYIIDSTLFQNIKKNCRLHTVKNAMKFHQYFKAFEISLEGYLTEKDSTEYPYYIAESLRRLIYTKQINRNKILYSGIYKGMFQLGFYNILDKKLYLNKCIESRKKELTVSRVFTYIQVFNYFLAKAIENDINDSRPILTKGLYNYSVKQKDKEGLKKYISMGGSNSDYIKYLIEPNDETSKTYKSLLVFNQVYTTSCDGKKLNHYFLEQSLNNDIHELTKNSYNELCPYEDKKYIYTREEIKKNYSQSIFYKNLIALTNYDINGKYDLGIVAPEFGQFIMDNRLTTLQIFDVIYVKCANPGVTALAAVGAGTYIQPTRYAISYLMFNSRKKKIIAEQKATTGNLTVNSFRYKLKYFLGRKNYPNY